MILQELVDRRMLCLGLWTLARHTAGEPLDAAWADDAIAASDALGRRETWAIAGKAFQHSMTHGDEKRAARHASRLGAYRAAAPAPGEFLSRDDIERNRQWRAATVHHWLGVGELLRRHRAAGGDVDRSWVAGVLDTGNLRNESSRPASADVVRSLRDLFRLAGDGLLVVEVEVDGDGPVRPLPPGARWYPKFRTVSLYCASGHLLVTGPGSANAVRSGPGFGSAIRAGAGHGNAVRRDGSGDAIRKGSGHGDAFREGAGDGLALRAGSGHGHAISSSLAASGAERRGVGHGNAVAEGGLVGACRSGTGNGTAYATAGPAFRSGAGAGDAVRVGPASAVPGEDLRAVRSGSGPGDAYGDLLSAGAVDRVGRGAGSVRPWPESPHCSWSALLARKDGGGSDQPSPSRIVHEAGSVRPPLYRIRVLRTGERRIPARAPVFYEAETNSLVLDTSDPGSIEVVGRGDVNVARRGSGPGDAVRSERGLGNAIRVGAGVGHAVRRGTGYGNAVRVGGGHGNAALGVRVVGDAVVSPPSRGQVLRPSDPAPVDLWSGLGSSTHDFSSGKLDFVQEP